MDHHDINLVGTVNGVTAEEIEFLKDSTANIQLQLDNISENNIIDTGHRNDLNNPHIVTKTQVGLSNVPNTNFTTDVANNTFHRGLSNNPHTVTKTQIGLSNVPNLDFSNASNITTGTLPSAVLPPIAITSTYTAASEVAQLALTTQEGDVVVRTDESRSYIHNGGSAGTMADFTELQTPTDTVLTVNGATGTVILNQDDVGNGATYVRTHNDLTDTKNTNLNTLSSDVMADSLHRHSELSASDGAPNPALKVDSVGQIGIGKTNPETALDIAGSLALDNDDKIQFRDTGGSRRNTLYVDINDNMIFGNNSFDKMHIYDGSGEIITLDGSGNVGIGTASPSAVLEVDGEAKLSDHSDMGNDDESLATKKYVDDNTGGTAKWG